MKKILQNMDSAVAGEKPAAPAEVGSMKAILESLHDVSDKEVVNEAATITVSAETGAEVADMAMCWKQQIWTISNLQVTHFRSN